MLAGTALAVLHDEPTGALAIRRRHGSSDTSPASPRPADAQPAPAGTPLEKPPPTPDAHMTPSRTPPVARRIIGAIGSLFVLATPLQAQSGSTGTVNGRVFNPPTGEYVRDAEVRIHGTGLVYRTH
jgi:hypothetical protein